MALGAGLDSTNRVLPLRARTGIGTAAHRADFGRFGTAAARHVRWVPGRRVRPRPARPVPPRSPRHRGGCQWGDLHSRCVASGGRAWPSLALWCCIGSLRKYLGPWSQVYRKLGPQRGAKLPSSCIHRHCTSHSSGGVERVTGQCFHEDLDDTAFSSCRPRGRHGSQLTPNDS